jgi:hypothetical protein
MGTGHISAGAEPMVIRGTRPASSHADDGDDDEAEVDLLSIPLHRVDSFHRKPRDCSIITWERRVDGAKTEYALSFLTVAGCQAVWCVP